MDNNSSSPVPAKVEEFPICSGCAGEVRHVKYLDYEGIRVVFHDPAGCTIGVMPVPKE